MNRSIFQLKQLCKGGKKFINILILVCLLFFIFNINNNVSCVNLKYSTDLSKYILQEMCHNNIKFFKTACINDYNAKIALDLFLEYKENNNFNYKISKYFLNKNGILVPFNKRSPFDHPNLMLGVFNDISINYQFSHNKVNPNFELFSKKDIIDENRNQFICKYLYMYSSDLIQLMLNYNDLNLNFLYYNLNTDLLDEISENSLEPQKFLDTNIEKFDKLVNNSLKY